MSVDDESNARDRRLTTLLAELDATPTPGAGNLAAHVVRRAQRQRAGLAVVQFLVALARAVPDAIAIGAGRRR